MSPRKSWRVLIDYRGHRHITPNNSSLQYLSGLYTGTFLYILVIDLSCTAKTQNCVRIVFHLHETGPTVSVLLALALWHDSKLNASKVRVQATNGDDAACYDLGRDRPGMEAEVRSCEISLTCFPPSVSYHAVWTTYRSLIISCSLLHFLVALMTRLLRTLKLAIPVPTVHTHHYHRH